MLGCCTLILWVLCLISIGLLGYTQCYMAQAIIANCAVVIPANILLTVLYLVLTPLRWLYSRFMNLIVTRFLSFGALKPTFWTADYATLLDAFPIAYSKVLLTDVMSLTESQARSAMRQRCATAPFPQLRRDIASIIPAWIMNSMLFRLIAAVVLTFVAWWLIGFTYIPLIIPNEQVQDQVFPHTKPGTHEAIQRPARHRPSTLRMRIPQCKFLVKAREKYGEKGGNTACMNE